MRRELWTGTMDVGPLYRYLPHRIKESIRSAKSYVIWSTSTDSRKNKLQDTNSWDDFINSNFSKFWDENAVAGFRDMLTREITAFCNCGELGGNVVLKLSRGRSIIYTEFGTE